MRTWQQCANLKLPLQYFHATFFSLPRRSLANEWRQAGKNSKNGKIVLVWCTVHTEITNMTSYTGVSKIMMKFNSGDLVATQQ